MPVAKHVSYAGSRSRTKRSRQIDGPSFAYLCVQHDEAPRARLQQAPLHRLAIAPIPIKSRSILRTVVQFVDAAGEIVWAVVSWIITEMLDGCAAYALSMYGIPEDVAKAEAGDPKPSAPPSPSRNRSKPKLHAISADRDVRPSELLSPPDAAQSHVISECATRSMEMPGPHSSWHSAISAPAVRLLSKIREGYARQRAVAELQNMDDRSLRDIGISRIDIGYIARHGVRPE